MSRTKWFLALALVALLLPATADAQRICFSFASETNPDGPIFYAPPPTMLFDGAPFNADGVVNLRMLVQPFCDVGPVNVRPVHMFVQSDQWAYMQAPFVFGNTVHNWALRGQVIFIDAITGALFLQIDFHGALLTSWSPSPTDMGQTATLQSSEKADPNILFTPGPELNNIMAAAGFPPNLLSVGEDFAFTLTNISLPGGPSPFLVPLDPFIGHWLTDWIADGSFSATAGQM